LLTNISKTLIKKFKNKKFILKIYVYTFDQVIIISLFNTGMGTLRSLWAADPTSLIFFKPNK